MNTQDQINALESRQLELQQIMASSDSHAAKCYKLGLKFRTQYPDEYTEYTAAREEYNTNEETLVALKLQAAQDAENDGGPDNGLD